MSEHDLLRDRQSLGVQYLHVYIASILRSASHYSDQSITALYSRPYPGHSKALARRRHFKGPSVYEAHLLSGFSVEHASDYEVSTESKPLPRLLGVDPPLAELPALVEPVEYHRRGPVHVYQQEGAFSRKRQVPLCDCLGLLPEVQVLWVSQ